MMEVNNPKRFQHAFYKNSVSTKIDWSRHLEFNRSAFLIARKQKTLLHDFIKSGLVNLIPLTNTIPASFTQLTYIITDRYRFILDFIYCDSENVCT